MAEPAAPIPTNTPAPDPSVTTQPVTSQPAPAPNTLETKQAGETFDALNKLFDEPTSTPKPVAPEVSATTGDTGVPKPAEAPKGTPVGTEDFKAKLDQFKAPLGAHPNVAAGMEQLKGLAAEAEARAVAAQAKLVDYEKMAQEFNELKTGNKLPEPIEKELKTLRDWRKEVDYRQDPEFQKAYVEPVKQADTEIMGLLKQAGMKDDVAKFIADNGGIIRLSQSGESAGQANDPNMTMADWVDKQLLGPTPAVFRNRIIGKLTQAQDAIERGRADLKNFQENSHERWEAKMKTMQADFEAGRDEAIAEIGDMAKLKTIQPTSTPEERVEIEAHNTRVKKAAELYDTYLKTNKDPKTAGRLLAKATQADVLLGLYQESQTTIKGLRDKLDGIKAAGGHADAGDHAPPPGTEKPSMSGLLKQSTDSAMTDLFKTVPSLQ